MAWSNWASTYEQVQNQEQVCEAERLNDSQAQNVDLTKSSEIVTQSIVVAKIESLDINDLKMYWWWKKIPAIDRQSVIDGVNTLPEPHNQNVTRLLKSNDVKWLQQYLNQNVSDKQGLKKALNAKWISYYNKILEDGKFWPQTLEALKFLIANNSEKDTNIDKQPKKPTKPIETKQPPKQEQKEEKEKWNGNWIYHEMSEQMGRLADRDKKKDRYDARNGSSDNFKVDANTKTITINTRERKWDQKNTCEFNWETWKINIICWKYTYEAPFQLKSLKLDSDGFPSESNNANREGIRAFTAIWNLMNKLKNVAVFQWKWAIEYQTGRNAGNVVWNVIWGWTASVLTGIPWAGEAIAGGVIAWLWRTWIHLNDWVIGWATDTLLVSDSSRKEVGKLCKQDFLDKNMQIKIASLLTAMKLDNGYIKWDPDVVDSRWLHRDPLDDEHKKRVKSYLKNPSLAN